MADDSRLLINDLLFPSTLTTSEKDVRSAWHDWIMMTISGKERTEAVWVQLLESAGLVVEKVWTKGGLLGAVIEARLAKSQKGSRLSHLYPHFYAEK